MISSFQNMKKARELRLFGKSYTEIRKEVNVSLGTLSKWLNDIVLSETQSKDLKNRVNVRMSRGRLNASITRRSTRIFNEKKIYDDSSKEFKHLAKDPFFMTGLVLYWAKGSKKSNYFGFTSSDKAMLVLMHNWIIKYLKVDEELVKQRKYNTYSSIQITRISVVRKVIAWQKLLIQYYVNVSNV